MLTSWHGRAANREKVDMANQPKQPKRVTVLGSAKLQKGGSSDTAIAADLLADGSDYTVRVNGPGTLVLENGVKIKLPVELMVPSQFIKEHPIKP